MNIIARKFEIIAVFSTVIPLILTGTVLRGYAQERSERQVVWPGSDAGFDTMSHLPGSFHLPGDSISLPGAQTIYSWEDPGLWDEELYSTFTYQENAQIDTNINYYEAGGTPFNRVTYAWDLSNRLIGRTIEKFDNNWSNFSHIEWDYDQYENPTTELNYIWFAGTWQLTTGNRSTYTYDDRTYITEVLKEKYNVLQYWFYDEKKEYLFADSAEPQEIIQYRWDNTQWAPMRRWHTITWDSYDGLRGEGSYQAYIADTFAQDWMNSLRRNYSYGSNGSYEYTEQHFRGNVWVNDHKFEELRDENLLPQEVKTSEWTGEEWRLKEAYRYSYVTGGIDLLEMVIESWDTASASYANYSRVVYSDFVHFLGVRENAGSLLAVKIFPNPASDRVVIDLTGMQAEMLIVSDLRGAVVRRVSLPGGSQKAVLELNDLCSGIYFLVLEGKGTVLGYGKLVKV